MPGRRTRCPPRHLSAGTTGVRPDSSRMIRRSSVSRSPVVAVGGHGRVRPFSLRHDGEGRPRGALARHAGGARRRGLAPAAAVVVLAAAETALDPQRAALAVYGDDGVVARRVAGPAEVVDGLAGSPPARLSVHRPMIAQARARDAARRSCDNPAHVGSEQSLAQDPDRRRRARDPLRGPGLPRERGPRGRGGGHHRRGRAGRARRAPRRGRPRPHAARTARPSTCCRASARSTRRCRSWC